MWWQENGFGDATVQVVVNPHIGMNTFAIGTLLSVAINYILIQINYTIVNTRQDKCSSSDTNVDNVLNNKLSISTTTQENLNDMEQNLLEYTHDNTLDVCIHPYNKMPSKQDCIKQTLFTRYVPSTVFGILLHSCVMVGLLFTIWSTFQSLYTAPIKFSISGIAGKPCNDSRIHT